MRDQPSRLPELALVFLRLGCTSFGGPVAHLGYLHAEVVQRRRWLDDAHFTDLVALCQFLPGPASSQLVFALGMHRGGLAGALVASACFTAPSALLMLGFAAGVARVPDLAHAGWLHGLLVAALAVVAQAVWVMGRKLCPDLPRAAIAASATAALLLTPGAWVTPAVIAAGGVVGWALLRAVAPVGPAAAAPGERRGRRGALAALGVWATLLVSLPALARLSGARAVAVFDAFYRSGSLVFGGGHVVLPLLQAELVPRGWLTDAQFLAGYGAAQALPGPLFTFAAYLGAAMAPGWTYGVLCLLAVFLPAWLLVGGALPFWDALRTKRWAQAALAGANAAVVGVLAAALYRPVFTESVRGPSDVVVAVAAFVLLERWKAPPWLVVTALAAAGQWLLPA